jgi:hypothetical protein
MLIRDFGTFYKQGQKTFRPVLVIALNAVFYVKQASMHGNCMDSIYRPGEICFTILKSSGIAVKLYIKYRYLPNRSCLLYCLCERIFGYGTIHATEHQRIMQSTATLF